MRPRGVPFGFVYDPITGRIFKEPDPNSGIKLPFYTLGAKPLPIARKPKVKNLVDVFFKSQCGNYNPQRRETDWQTAILQSDQIVTEGSLQFGQSEPPHSLVCSCTLFQNNRCYGVWKRCDASASVGFFAEFNISDDFNFNYAIHNERLDAINQRLIYCTTRMRVVDMCFSKIQDEFYILASNTSSFPYRSHLELIRSDGERVSMINLRLEAPVWSCCSNDIVRTIFVGMENQIRSFDADSLLFNKQNMVVHGKVHSVSSVSEHIFFAGLHNGTVLIGDDRGNSTSMTRIDMHNKGISDIKVFKDEKDIICRAFDGTMFLYDLRSSQVRAKFTGNAECIRRLHLTFDEQERLVCDVGDGKARLWTFNGGEPVKVISFENSDQNQCIVRGGLIRKNGNVGLLLFHGDNFSLRRLM